MKTARIEVLPGYHKVAMGDVGGGTARYGRGIVSRDLKQVKFENLSANEIKFDSSRELITSIFDRLIQLDLTGIKTVIISIAGPVDTKAGTIIKMTNQGKKVVEERDIPIRQILTGMLCEKTGRDIRVEVINDAYAGDYAEFCPEGALGHLKTGEIGTSLIIGNGVGGVLMMKTRSGKLVVCPGGDEPGHRRIPWEVVNRFRIGYLTGKKCGCEVVGSSQLETGPCLEKLTQGPSMEWMFQRRAGRSDITNKSITRYLQETTERYPGFAAAFKPDGQAADPSLLKDIFSLRGAPGRRSALLSASLSGAKREEQELLADIFGVLSNEAYLLANSFLTVQQGIELSAGTMHVALIGGVGHWFGPWLTPLMDEAVREQKGLNQMTAWGKSPRFYVGKWAPDQTNLAGDAVYAAILEGNK